PGGVIAFAPRRRLVFSLLPLAADRVRRRMSHLRFAAFLLFGLLPVFADTPKSGDVVVPTVSLSDKVPLPQALKDVQRQTGVGLTETLGKGAPDVSLNLDKVSFWRAVDAIAIATNA